MQLNVGEGRVAVDRENTIYILVYPVKTDLMQIFADREEGERGRWGEGEGEGRGRSVAWKQQIKDKSVKCVSEERSLVGFDA